MILIQYSLQVGPFGQGQHIHSVDIDVTVAL